MTSESNGHGGPTRVVVVGAGVVGLTCAVRLLEGGHRVDVLARDLPRETTSVVAAALWYPYRAEPQERTARWAATSYQVFAGLADDPATGVRMLPGTEALRWPAPDPWWRSAVPALEATEPPDGYAGARRFTTPVVDMAVHLDWLRGRLLKLGGTLTRLNLRALPTGADMVVNCSGIGARLLAGDLSVVPVRGQVVHVAPFGLDEWWLDGDGPTYVVPLEDHVVVGGTDEEGEWSRTPSPESARAILERAASLVPSIADAQVLRHRVGLRPARSTVRLERDGRVVHCYGHGGAGVTLAWGCAAEVAGLVSGA
ncbi:FAD-dependent oxidoreductase [Nocardioides ferulae]|uniref:FAD-dependent oxidoreductase n=1 Tax=Nocardioides ferulae TaxID=2340821 RepID=UPI000EB59DDE|nr:FAD-dependent oxidoreductase [Nocardioides ferulae]